MNWTELYCTHITVNSPGFINLSFILQFVAYIHLRCRVVNYTLGSLWKATLYNSQDSEALHGSLLTPSYLPLKGWCLKPKHLPWDFSLPVWGVAFMSHSSHHTRVPQGSLKSVPEPTPVLSPPTPHCGMELTQPGAVFISGSPPRMRLQDIPAKRKGIKRKQHHYSGIFLVNTMRRHVWECSSLPSGAKSIKQPHKDILVDFYCFTGSTLQTSW